MRFNTICDNLVVAYFFGHCVHQTAVTVEIDIY